MNNIYADDVLVALFYHVEDLDNFYPKFPEIQKAIFKISKDNPKISKIFPFRDRGLYYTCRPLNQAIINLLASNILYRRSDCWEYYYINQDNLKKLYEEFVGPLIESHDLLDTFKELGSRFYEFAEMK